MRVVETLTKQHPETSLRTDFGTMQSLETYEATIRCKEKVGIGTHQMREHIKSCTVYSYEDRGREMRLWEEFDPVDVVVIRHVP
jgi:hypothetical protein